MFLHRKRIKICKFIRPCNLRKIRGNVKPFQTFFEHQDDKGIPVQAFEIFPHGVNIKSEITKNVSGKIPVFRILFNIPTIFFDVLRGIVGVCVLLTPRNDIIGSSVVIFSTDTLVQVIQRKPELISVQAVSTVEFRNIALAQTLGTEEQAMAFAKEIMKLCINAPEGVSSPWFGPKIADLLHNMYGLDYDRFRQEKLDSNRFVLERLPMIRKRVTESKDPVLAGLQFAILGNYLDFSALQGQVSFEKLEEMLDKALEMELDEQVYAYFCRDLRRGGKLVYLTDNAGEIGFDRVLAEAIAAAYPDIAITFCVRGAIAQNDATREDAAAVGIPFPVIDNGNRVAGTQLDMLSEEAAAALSDADVILAKGMANAETMLGCGYNVYYAFLVKCQRFVTRFGKPMFTPMLVKERE